MVRQTKRKEALTKLHQLKEGLKTEINAENPNMIFVTQKLKELVAYRTVAMFINFDYLGKESDDNLKTEARRELEVYLNDAEDTMFEAEDLI